MRASLLIFVCLISALAASAQRVIEGESTARIEGDSAIVRLVTEDTGARADVTARVETVDTADVVKGFVVMPLRLGAGRKTHEFRIPLSGAAAKDNENLAWYRVRYRIGQATGTISLSQILADLFELRIVATDNILAGMKYRVRVRAVNPFTRAPAAGVRIEAAAKLDLKGEGDLQLNLRAVGETGADGFAVLDMQVPAGAEFDGDGEITVTGRRNGIVREAEEDLNATGHNLQAITMTDKPIYQPGQSLSVRAIVLKGAEGGIVVMPDKEVEFRIEDGDDTLLHRERVRTSAFGVAAVSWRVPANAMLGDYRISIRDDDDEQIYSQTVKVSRYDLPNFVVHAKPSKPFYLPSDKRAEIEINADYLFGKPVTRGRVRVVREKERRWNWKEQKYDIDEGESREGETDARGRFTARFDLSGAHEDLEDDDWRLYEDLKFAAYFTDPTTNKTEQRRFDLRVSREPIHVYLIQGRDFGNARLPMAGYVSTFYADGAPAECDVEVAASEEDEDKFRTYARVRTNSLGAGKFAMRRPDIGEPGDDLDFRLTARDARGRTGTSRDTNVYFNDDDDGLRIFTDRAIYKPGETVHVRVESTVPDGTVHIDVVKGWSVIASHAAELKKGKARLLIPYRGDLRGELTVAASVEDPDDEDELISGGRGIIFPAKEGVRLDARFDKPVYKPNEEARLSFDLADASGRALEGALGVVVYDKAVEERARTDAEFGGMFSRFGGWFGYGRGFGAINVKDLNELDLSKPIPAELQTVAEAMLHDAHYYPNSFRSRRYHEEAGSVFRVRVGNEFARIRAALGQTFHDRGGLHPTDEASLKSILASRGLDLAAMRDPWGMPYRAEFAVDKARDIVRILTAGPDKAWGTRDDFAAFSEGYDYFANTGKAVDAAVKRRYARTGEFIRSKRELKEELGVGELLDRFGRPYRVVLAGDGRLVRLKVVSAGPDGVFSSQDYSYNWYYGDDFEVWSTPVDIFERLEPRIIEIQRGLKRAPMTEAEFRKTLRDGGVDLDAFRDANGQPLAVGVQQRSRYWDRVTVENVQAYGDPRTVERRTVTPVTQQVVEFTIKGPGRDRKHGTYDDVTFAQYVHVLTEQSKDDPKPVVRQPVAFDANTGSISGTVTDVTGAVVAAAKVTATNSETSISRETETNADGRFLIANLPPGKYTVKADALGFKTIVVQGVLVDAGGTASMDLSLEAGGVSEVVNVTAEAAVMDTTDSKVQTTITSRQIATLPKGTNFSSLLKLAPGAAKGKDTTGPADEPNSTPRVREYFPETLLWQPEVVTNADGKAEVKFRMADNITTWKMYTIASTRDGKVGFAEKETTAFQSFFVDLDPPKFLTAGDEIHLPAQVRNYTDKRQAVSVTMAPADWFTLLAGDRRQVEVDAGQSQNAVFGFRAATPVNEGKQRVTAVATADSDAIERPVTVRPDGREHVHTESRFASGSSSFHIEIPANALAAGRTAELRIYPNQLAHVVESVEGLLQRPYGCGEQTISSTYPNVMILKFAATGRIDAAIERKARKYLASGYERLLGYQVGEGGFSYWGGKDEPDAAVTAYALRFLADASRFIAVDPEVVKKAEAWLVRQQRADGSWNRRYSWETTENVARARSTTTYIARTLAMTKAASGAQAGGGEALARALDYLRASNAEIDDPYSLSLFGLAALDAGDEPLAREVAGRLAAMGKEEAGGTYWNLESNTAFNGWGSAGRVETTALAAQLLTRLKMEQPLVGRAMLFLLKNKDRYGVWYSTQTTVNVLDAFVTTMAGADDTAPGTVEVLVNGRPAERIEIAAGKLDRIAVDISRHIGDGRSTVELRTASSAPLMAQIVAGHYTPWAEAADADGRTVNASRALRLAHTCDRAEAAIMQEVTCTVEAERVGHRGYGMLLAEIGTPPGADVSRESLEAASADWSISRYDVLPDRVRIYMWARPGGTKFTFKFRPRYGIEAKTPASVIYDYYNPEAQAVVAPLSFRVR